MGQGFTPGWRQTLPRNEEMKRELLIKGVISARWLQAEASDPVRWHDALGRVWLLSQDLPTLPRRDSGGWSRFPKALILETKVLLCSDVGVWARRRHLIAPASWEHCVWGGSAGSPRGLRAPRDLVGWEQTGRAVSALLRRRSPGPHLRPTWIRKLI